MAKVLTENESILTRSYTISTFYQNLNLVAMKKMLIIHL